MFASSVLNRHETIPLMYMCAIGLMVLNLPRFLFIPSRNRVSQSATNSN